MCVCLQLQLAEMEARVVGAETRAEIAEEKVNVIRFCWVFWLGFFLLLLLFPPPAARAATVATAAAGVGDGHCRRRF